MSYEVVTQRVGDLSEGLGLNDGIEDVFVWVLCTNTAARGGSLWLGRGVEANHCLREIWNFDGECRHSVDVKSEEANWGAIVHLVPSTNVLELAVVRADRVMGVRPLSGAELVRELVSLQVMRDWLVAVACIDFWYRVVDVVISLYRKRLSVQKRVHAADDTMRQGAHRELRNALIDSLIILDRDELELLEVIRISCLPGSMLSIEKDSHSLICQVPFVIALGMNL